MIAPLFAPAGFGNWEATGSLITGMVAKEVIIGSMSQVYVDTDASSPDDIPMPIQQAFGESVQGFGHAIIYTGQEFINIIPRTINRIPIVTVPELSLNDDDDTESNSKLEQALRQHFTMASAIAFTTFVLLYVPCTTTLVAMRQEFGKSWVLQQILYTLVIAWSASIVVYQVTHALGV